MSFSANCYTFTYVHLRKGNGGTAIGEKVSNVDIGVSDFARLTKFALENEVSFFFFSFPNIGKLYWY